VLVELSKMEQRYQAVLAVQADGLSVVEVAEKLGVSRQTVHSWLRLEPWNDLVRESGTIHGG
jgi:uncharacterized protein YjcR